MSVHRTHRWRGVIAVALVAGAVGIVADRPEILLLSVVGVAFAAYPRMTPTPAPSLALDRRLSDPSPTPGDRVHVTVTVENRGSWPLLDARFVDGVPPALSVVEGTPRRGLTLRPGGSTTFSYAIETESGVHGFEAATVVARDVSGDREVETTVAADTSVECTAQSASNVHRDLTLDQVGRVLSSQGGSGVEFHRTREYQRGDSLARVDWKRYANTGDLSTVEFREEHATSVVLLVDTREAAYRARSDQPHAVVHGLAAARLLLDTLLERRNRVGIAAFGRRFTWLAPDIGREHRLRAERMLSTDDAFLMSPPTDESPLDEQIASLRTRLPVNAQILLLSPLIDADIAAAARRLEAHGHPVTVISPDVTTAETVGERLVGVERQNRLSALRRSGVPVVDWDPENPLSAALADAHERRRA